VSPGSRRQDRVVDSSWFRRFELTDEEYARIAPLLPDTTPQCGGRWRDHRQVIDGILFRVRTGCPWRDVPDRYGPYQTLYKRFSRWEQDGTWARIEAAMQADADAVGELDWHGLPTPPWCGRTSTPRVLAKRARGW